MKRTILFVASLALATSSVYSQSIPRTGGNREEKQQKKEAKRERINQLIRQEEEGEIVFHKQSVFSVKLATDGYGIGYEFGKYKADRKAILFNFELSEKKHPKEKKEGQIDGSGFKVNYIAFGKTNTFYQARFGAAMQQVIGGKGNKNGVSVSAIYGGGLTLGMVKPYVVEVAKDVGGGYENIDARYPEIVDSGYIELRAKGLAGGWSDLKVRPGAYVKTAMRFDYGRLNETVTAIEVGLSAEYYAAKISQMMLNKDKQFFFNAYIALLLGRRK